MPSFRQSLALPSLVFPSFDELQPHIGRDKWSSYMQMISRNIEQMSWWCKWKWILACQVQFHFFQRWYLEPFYLWLCQTYIRFECTWACTNYVHFSNHMALSNGLAFVSSWGKVCFIGFRHDRNRAICSIFLHSKSKGNFPSSLCYLLLHIWKQ